MKKKFYFATLVIALLTFTGCANDEYVGDKQNLGEQNGAIAFSTKSENTVRGESDNSADAEKLNKQFWVYGTKKVGEENKPVFNNYRVEYRSGTASSSNTNGWEYVGKGDNQTIKYWDYSASKYDFEAYSYKSSTGSVTRQTQDDASCNLKVGDYKVTAAPEDLYFAQKKNVDPGNSGNAVQLSFKSVLSKIRVGFYETLPGHSVKIDKFYGPDNSGNTRATEDDGNYFVAWCPNKKVNDNHPFAVSYSGTEPVVTKVANSETDPYYEINATSSNYTLDQTLTLGGNLITQESIGDSYSTVTWDQVDADKNPIYTYFIPQEGNSQVQPMKIKVDYTLTSDKDNSGEEINVKGATAIVPAEYLKWAPNKAYSYVFKISDQTNGNTGGTDDPAGLSPITFDAFVEDMAESTDHLTTVSELSITATQDGKFAEADKAVFKTSEEIKVKVMQYYTTEEGVLTAADRTSNVGASTPAPGDSFKAVFKTNYDPSKSIEDYEIEMSTITSTTDVITLGSQTNAGYWIVKVTYNDKGTNITKYAVLKVG